MWSALPVEAIFGARLGGLARESQDSLVSWALTLISKSLKICGSPAGEWFVLAFLVCLWQLGARLVEEQFVVGQSNETIRMRMETCEPFILDQRAAEIVDTARGR